MSREIDISHPESLSDEDIAYLRARGRVNVIQILNEEEKRRRAADTQVEEVDEPYEKWNVDELREELKNRGLPSDGNKKDLVARLEENDASE
jgi:hypothetical protein